jgi:hypothetical protein
MTCVTVSFLCRPRLQYNKPWAARHYRLERRPRRGKVSACSHESYGTDPWRVIVGTGESEIVRHTALRGRGSREEKPWAIDSIPGFAPCGRGEGRKTIGGGSERCCQGTDRHSRASATPGLDEVHALALKLVAAWREIRQFNNYEG